MINSRSVTDLRPDVRANCEIWKKLCEEHGLQILITSTLRDDEYQATLYAQGRTRPGSIVTNSLTTTFHGQGLAWDFCKNVRGHEYDDLNFFKEAATIAKQMGFTWGGDWKSFVDRPHIQWDNHTLWTTAMLRKYKNGVGTPCPQMPLYEIKNEEEDVVVYINTMKELREQAPWAETTISKLCKARAITGGGAAKDDEGYPMDLNLSVDMIRMFVINDRMGLYPIASTEG